MLSMKSNQFAWMSCIHKYVYVYMQLVNEITSNSINLNLLVSVCTHYLHIKIQAKIISHMFMYWALHATNDFFFFWMTKTKIECMYSMCGSHGFIWAANLGDWNKKKRKGTKEEFRNRYHSCFLMRASLTE